MPDYKKTQHGDQRYEEGDKESCGGGFDKVSCHDELSDG